MVLNAASVALEAVSGAEVGGDDKAKTGGAAPQLCQQRIRKNHSFAWRGSTRKVAAGGGPPRAIEAA